MNNNLFMYFSTKAKVCLKQNIFKKVGKSFFSLLNNLFILFLIPTFLILFTTNAFSSNIKDIAESIKKPIILKSQNQYNVSVVFNHTSHKGINCIVCHHEKYNNEQYVSCSVCHKARGRSNDSDSLFLAFHSKEVKRSCFLCHADLLKNEGLHYKKEFVNCKPCHTKMMSDIIKEPITLKAKKSKLLNVTFNHTSHRGISCFTCHHKKSDSGQYVSCKECHTSKGRTNEKMSEFVSYHSKKSSHSCYACHLNKALQYPKEYGKLFINCRPCHQAKK